LEQVGERELARAGNCFGDFALIGLSRGIQDQEEDPKLDHDHARKLQLHERLAGLSTRGHHLVVANNGHDIPEQASEAVIEATRSVLAQTPTAQHTVPR
jgi:hypothetical protein